MAGTSTKSDIVIHGFRDGFFPFQGELIKETFEDLKKSFAPDLILTHHDDDRHQDHRLVSQLTWNTWRDHMILEYEIMKYDGDLGRPNVFVPLSQDVCQDKIGSLLEVFPSQSQATMVQRGGVLVAAAAARHRVQRAVAACRSILRAQNPCLTGLALAGTDDLRVRGHAGKYFEATLPLKSEARLSPFGLPPIVRGCMAPHPFARASRPGFSGMLIPRSPEPSAATNCQVANEPSLRPCRPSF